MNKIMSAIGGPASGGKKIILAAGVVLFFAAACSQQQTPTPPPSPAQSSNNPAPAPNPNPAPVPPSASVNVKGVITPNQAGYLYTNDYYGFKLQFPGSFEGLQLEIKTDPNNSEIKYIKFEVPMSKCVSEICYMNPVTASIYSNSVWQSLSKEPPYSGYEVKSNASYTVSVIGWQEPEENTPAADQIGKDIGKVQSSLEVY